MDWLKSEAETTEREIWIETEDFPEVSRVVSKVQQRKSRHFVVVRSNGSIAEIFVHLIRTR